MLSVHIALAKVEMFAEITGDHCTVVWNPKFYLELSLA